MQCDISLHCACKLAFESPSPAYPCVYFSCSSNALTLTSASLTFPSSEDKARNAKYSTNNPKSSFLCHSNVFFRTFPKFLPCVIFGTQHLVGGALQQEKVTPILGTSEPRITQNHRIIQLEEIFKVIQSNYSPCAARVPKPCPSGELAVLFLLAVGQKSRRNLKNQKGKLEGSQCTRKGQLNSVEALARCGCGQRAARGCTYSRKAMLLDFLLPDFSLSPCHWCSSCTGKPRQAIKHRHLLQPLFPVWRRFF